MSDELSDPTLAAAGLPRAASAGRLLRAAREAQGLHIAALAAAIKVTPRRLEALEGDRHDELLDLTFVRALAQAVCRALKIDAAPVLALLPQAGVEATRLAQVSSGLNTPFRERPGRRPPEDWAWLRRPAFWATALVLLGAVALYSAPADWLAGHTLQAGAPAAAVGAASQPAAVADGAVPPPLEAPVGATDGAPAAGAPDRPPAEMAEAASGAGAGAVPASGIVVLRAAGGASWVEVQDGAGSVLIARTLAAGETVSFDGPAPFKLKIGNAAATELRFRGQPVDLKTRDNVARLELK